MHLSNCRTSTSQLAKLGAAALIFAGLMACSSAPATTGAPLATTLSKTAAGKGVLTWVNGLEAGAGAALQKVNAKLGLTPADVANLCAWDNTAHSAIGVVELVPVIPATVAPIDNTAHAIIQDACALAATGALPASTSLGSIVSEAQAFATDLGLKV